MSISKSAASAATTTPTQSVQKITIVDYEIFGTVQGVFFRKYTKRKAGQLNIQGWVKNTATKTVVGQIQGSEEKINRMKYWLKTEGSPKAKIKRCVFKNEHKLDKPLFHEFRIVLD